MSVTEKVAELVDGLDQVSSEAAVYAALARNLAESLDDPDLAAYSKPNLVKQLREVLQVIERMSW